MTDDIQADIAAVSQIPLINTLLDVICETTGMRFAAVARVTDTKWVTCATKDLINFGLKPGDELPLTTTICDEIRQSHQMVVIDDVALDKDYKDHHTPAMYGLKSYISIPIFRRGNEFFGTLCAIDPEPKMLNNPRVIGMFTLFAELIAFHLDTAEKQNKSESELVREQKIVRLQQIYNKDLALANEKLAATQKQQEELLKQLTSANAKLQQAIETGNMGTWSIDPVSYEVTMSEYIRELFGFPSEGAISVAQILETIDPAYQEALATILSHAMLQRKDSDIEYPIKNIQTGERNWVRATGRLFFDEEDNITVYSGVLMDITNRKRDEDKQAMLAAIIESSEDAIVSKTLDGIITSWNNSAERMFGFREHEAVGKHISIIIPDDRLAEETQIISKVRNSERVEHFETMRRAKAGNEVPLSLTVSPIRNEKGDVIGASKIARDISRQKEAEERLQSYAEHMEILNTIGQTISADLDTQGILQKVTDATTQLTGAAFGAFFHNLVNDKGESYTLYTLSGAPREAFEKFGMPRNTKVFAPTFSGDAIVRVDDITKDPRYGKNKPHKGMPDGHLPVVSYLAVPVRSKNGEVIGGLFFGHPKAAMFKKEHEQLAAGVAAQAAVALDNAKLYGEIKVLNAKKDEFIGLASHELKTPLTGINGYLQIIERSMPADDRNKNFIKKALAQVGKLTSLISDLLDVSKIQTGKLPLSYAKFDLSTILTEVSDMMQQSHITHQIELHYNKKSIHINADQQRIEQVLINLITNAIKYSPGAGKVIINAELIGEKVKVSVRDFGIGIDKDQHDRIFSRFYRVENLAAHMSGLGIGLYISHEIIERHKGKMWVDSELGKGSTFTFELPVG
ncbi:PAS domain S-box protein [Mucilaginibacter sp. dw_454]|uniref:PAS domain S-box protein n=1 Tax=Mucilaginibacter sp. dw_454 TaxID=2720079 RepID=UPI001BD50270|nr:PAS domain S-box protein [Mucilaginibacter sp. dw_454]